MAISAGAFVDYIRESAAIWELLAYVKLRGVAGPDNLANELEHSALEAVFERAAELEPGRLAVETRDIRDRLERIRARGREVDIKYGQGGMLDIYFATRFIQLRDSVRDDADARSTSATLRKLHANGSLNDQCFRDLSEGYSFLADLDHAIRLFHGRTTKLKAANQKVMSAIATRMGFLTPAEVPEQLSLHRIAVRRAFDHILGGA
jgi:glutamate-ammonia-ligase adenylyltransferase